MKWYLKVLRDYAKFGGRARRKEYWMFTLFNSIFYLALDLLAGILGLNSVFSLDAIYSFDATDWLFRYIWPNWISGTYGILLIVPSIAVVVRRLHDTNRTGWMFLIGLIPLIGSIWLFVLMVLDGTVGDNKYGVDPKGRNLFEQEDIAIKEEMA